MDKILDKIIRQFIVEATTRKRLTKQIDSDTILTKLIKQVITEAAQKVVLSKLDNKVAAIVSNYGFGFKISANYPITADQVRTWIQTNSQFGTNSPYNSYLNYTYFVGSNMHKNPNKKFVANVVIINAKRMNSFNSARFNAAVKNLLEPDDSDVDVVVSGYRVNTVGRKNADLEAQHHKARGPEAVYNSTETGEVRNEGSDLIFIDTDPGYANLPADLMTVLTKKGAALMSTSGSEVPGFMSADDDVAPSDSTKTDDKPVDAAFEAVKSGNAKMGVKDYKGAIVDYTKAIELDPTLKDAYINRGHAKSKLQDYIGAIADFTKAIEVDPDYHYPYYYRGKSKMGVKDYKGAIVDFTKAIEFDPDDRYFYYYRGESKNLLEPGTGDEDMRAYSTMAAAADAETQDKVGSIKKQTFKYGIKDNADLKTLQDEIKTQLKASDNQPYIESVPSFKAFMNVANMTGYYGPLTSNMIAQLKKAYTYKNTDGKTIESEFIEILIDEMNSKLKLTEQFNFTDREKKLISNTPIVVNTKTDDTKTDDTKTDDTKTVKLKNLDQIPLGSNNWRSAQPTSTQIAKFIVEKGIKSVIRFNGNGTDTDNNFSIDDEKAVSTQNGAKFYKLSSTKDQDTVNSLLNSGNVLIHCHHGADRTGGNIGGWLYSKGWGDTKKIWDYTTKYNGWNRMAINSPSSFSKGGYLYQATKFGVKDINHAQELASGNKSIKKNDTKTVNPKTVDTKKVALTKAYQLCLDAAKDLRKITTTNPHKYWKQYLRWDGLSYRPNANKKGIAWFKSAWDKAWGTKLAAASKIRSTVNQKNINELNRRKNDVIEMIRKGGSMTVYLRIQNPFNGTPTDFKIKWDYLSGIQNAAFKGNPKKPVTKKPSSKIGGNLGR
jgi:tetratricopeptide (TPR) repeat protein